MRADVNVSVRRAGEAFGTRTETKNVNSVRFVMAAVEAEARRQVDVLEAGGTIVQETRLFDPDRMTTRSMRSKEDAHDYRYFPDPDLLPVELTRRSSPTAPRACPNCRAPSARATSSSLGLSPYDAAVLTAERETADWFEALLADLVRRTGKPGFDLAKAASNWVTGELFGVLKRTGVGIEASPVTPAGAAELLALVDDTTLSGSLAKQVFEAMVETGDSAATIVEARGLRQVSDTGAIDAAIAAILAANPDKVADYRGGKDKLFGFFVGQTMRAMAGKANPAVVNERLKAALARLGRATAGRGPSPSAVRQPRLRRDTAARRSAAGSASIPRGSTSVGPRREAASRPG